MKRLFDIDIKDYEAGYKVYCRPSARGIGSTITNFQVAVFKAERTKRQLLSVRSARRPGLWSSLIA